LLDLAREEAVVGFEREGLEHGLEFLCLAHVMTLGAVHLLHDAESMALP
jgi:hypothetical protein